MRYSAAFADQLDSLGIWWPRGDGEALRSASRAWTDVADLLDEITQSLDHAQQVVHETYRGAAAAGLAELWREWSGDDGHLADTATDCRRLAAALTDFGGDVDLAHTTLVGLIESVVGGGSAATPDDVEWLRSAAGEVGEQLDHRATTRGRALSGVGQVSARVPADRAAIDPAQVSWVDPGDPDDLSFLVTSEVDLGAGQGEIGPLLPGPDDPGSPWSPGPGWSPGVGWSPGTGWTPGGDGDGDGDGDGRPCGPPVTCPPPICRDGPGDVDPGDVDRDGAGPGDDASNDGDPSDDLYARAGARAVRVSTLDPDDTGDAMASIDGGDPTGSIGGGSIGGSGGGGIDMTGIFDDALESEPLPDLDLPGFATDAAVPVHIGPPTASVAPGSPATPMASPLDAAAATGGGGRSGRMPFMPMMPMMGGAGGEDGDEPRRRRTKRSPWPLPHSGAFVAADDDDRSGR